jgi:hypothetical protein
MLDELRLQRAKVSEDEIVHNSTHLELQPAELHAAVTEVIQLSDCRVSKGYSCDSSVGTVTCYMTDRGGIISFRTTPRTVMGPHWASYPKSVGGKVAEEWNPSSSRLRVYAALPPRCTGASKWLLLTMLLASYFCTFVRNLWRLFAVRWFTRSRGSSVSIASDYGLDDRAIGIRSPVGVKDFSSNLCVQTGSEVHPASCTMGTGDSSLGTKRGRGVTLTTHPHLGPRSRMSTSYTSSPKHHHGV